MESTSSDRWSNRPRRTATHERRVPSNIPPSPAPLSSTMKRLPASTLSGNHRLSALQLQPQPTPPDPGLSDDPPSPQQHWQRVLDRPLKTLSGLHTHQGPQLILPASVLTTAIGATERQLRKPGDPTMQAAGERQRDGGDGGVDQETTAGRVLGVHGGLVWLRRIPMAGASVVPCGEYSVDAGQADAGSRFG